MSFDALQAKNVYKRIMQYDNDLTLIIFIFGVLNRRLDQFNVLKHAVVGG